MTIAKEPKATKPATAAKTRVFDLAKELKIKSTEVIEFCKELGYSGITNQFHGLATEQIDSIKDRLKKGPPKSAAASANVAPPPVKATIPPVAPANKIRTIAAPKVVKPVVVEQPVEEIAEAFVEPPIQAEPVYEAPPAPVVEAKPEPAATPAAPAEAAAPNLAAIAGSARRPTNLNRPATARPKPPEAAAPDVKVAPPVVAEKVSPPVVEVAPPAPEVVAEKVPEAPAPVAPTAPVPAPLPTNLPPNKPPSLNTPRPNSSQTLPPRPQNVQARPPMAPRPGMVGAPPRPPGQSVPQGNPNRPTQGPSGGNTTNLQGRPQQQQGQSGGSPPNLQQQGQGQQRPMGPGGQQQRPMGPGGPGGQNRGGDRDRGPSNSGPRGSSMPQRNRDHGPRTGGGPMGPGGPAKPAATPSGPVRPAGQIKLTPEQIARMRELSSRGVRIDNQALTKVLNEPKPGQPGAPGGPPRPGDDRPAGPSRPGMPGKTRAEEEEEKKKGLGAVPGRDARAKGRATTGRDRKSSTDRNAVIIGAGGSVEMIEQKSGSRRGPRQAMLDKIRRRQMLTTVKKEGPVEIAEPITVRALSEAIGMKTGELGKRLLKETNRLFGNNSIVPFDVAELIAIEKGITLVLKKQATAESRLLDAYEQRAREVDPALLMPRAPIVTIMGHVDHGKTSLLDKIRQEFGVVSDVVSTEAGGITQVIRAWQVAKDEKRVTFLDTPGHEAFTKMRARGAKVTDIAVIVVAATDGVMPQTEEAIAHAKAADVDIIVAINKVDMPNANLDKTRRQLYSLELLPDDMGGDIPFVETSAVTGQGIAELLESILLVAELADLKADPSHPASGTCLEAYQDSDEGVKATLIVQQGTLRKGDVVLCGATFGRIRAMYNDLGKPITEAGPSTPVKITGLDDVPDADDPFYAVEDVGTAREIAEQRKVDLRQATLTGFAPAVSLEQFTAAKDKAKITELKVVLKAEARGSVEAIKKELEKLLHDEVRCRVLHSGVGAITESDITLALTSPSDTIIVGFNVTADDAALKLAENRKVSISEFDIIYKLTDYVKGALEGKLKPVEEVIHLGRAIVRDTFKVTKVGTIAGCYVTSGVVERSARVRVIRNGVVIYPQGEKVIGLDSLKRFKDDAKEVREGFECGMKVNGYDDIKIDDVIEAFKIEVKMRTL